MQYLVKIIVDVSDADSPQQAAREAKAEVSQRIFADKTLAFEVTDGTGYEHSFDA